MCQHPLSLPSKMPRQILLLRVLLTVWRNRMLGKVTLNCIHQRGRKLWQSPVHHALNTTRNHLSHLDRLSPHHAIYCEGLRHNNHCLIGTILKIPNTPIWPMPLRPTSSQ
jgi:hypothetical protein